MTTERKEGRQGACHREVAQNEREHDHDHVIEVIRGRLRRHGLDRIVGCKRLPANGQADKAHQHGDDDKSAEKHERHRVALERMDGLHHAGTGDERSYHNEGERETCTHDAPALESAALAIDRETVHERKRNHPRKKARVLNGVPRPISAPAEHDVRPDGAESDADAEEEPAEHGVAARTDNPFRACIIDDERGNRVGERNRKARIADKQRRRMDGLSPMLEQRAHAEA